MEFVGLTDDYVCDEFDEKIPAEEITESVFDSIMATMTHPKRMDIALQEEAACSCCQASVMYTPYGEHPFCSNCLY